MYISSRAVTIYTMTHLNNGFKAWSFLSTDLQALITPGAEERVLKDRCSLSCQDSKCRQCPLLAPLVCGSQLNGMRMSTVCVCMCVCVCGWNELKVCTMVSFLHMSVYSVLCQCIHTNTCILKPFVDRDR